MKKKERNSRDDRFISLLPWRERSTRVVEKGLSIEDREILVEVRETVTHKFSRLLSLVYASSVFHVT